MIQLKDLKAINIFPNKTRIRNYFKKFSIVTIGIFIISCFLYHNDSFYNFFEKTINSRINNYLHVDALKSVNKIAHFLNVKGKAITILNPVEDSEVIELFLTDSNYIKLQKLAAKGPVSKDKWIKAKLEINDSLQKVKLKFHGTSLAHYQDGKFSYRIKISKKSQYLNEMRVFNLIKGEEADPTQIAANQFADKLGMISSSGKMVLLKINGINEGHYYLVEHISKEFLERKYGITNYSMISNVTDWTRKENEFYGSNHISDHDLFFGHIEKKGKRYHDKAVGMYKLFSEAIVANDLVRVKQMIDIEYMGKFLALLSVFNDIHFVTGDNLKFVYDFPKRKFFPIYRQENGAIPLYNQVYVQDDIFFNSYANYNNLVFYKSNPSYTKSKNTFLLKLLLSDNEVRNMRDVYLNKIVNERTSIVEELKKVYRSNEKVLYASSQSRREIYFQRKLQIDVFNTMCNLASKYLTYGHVYGSYDEKTNELNFIADAFCNVKMLHKTEKGVHDEVRGIELTPSLEFKYNYEKYIFDKDSINIKKLRFVNLVTGDTISKKHVHINYSEGTEEVFHINTLTSLNANDVKYSISDSVISIIPGTYKIFTDVVINPPYSLFLSRETTLLLDERVNIIVNGELSADGVKDQKVIVRNMNESKNFGVFAVIGQSPEAQTKLNYFEISGGSEVVKYGMTFTGQFAVYSSDVTISNSSFSNSMGDDGLNVKYGKVDIHDCQFNGNKADQVDLDFCIGKVTRSVFNPSSLDSNGDGLDVSGSKILIEECYFSDFLDKGISVGENSKAFLSSNNFDNNAKAIAIKDQSTAFSYNNSMKNNHINYSMFVKKKIFRKPILYISTPVNNEKIENIQGEIILIEPGEILKERDHLLEK